MQTIRTKRQPKQPGRKWAHVRVMPETFELLKQMKAQTGHPYSTLLRLAMQILKDERKRKEE